MAISGVDRYQTAALVADVFLVLLGSEGPVVAGFATGANFPDALSGGAVMALLGRPMLLTIPTTLNAHSETFLTQNRDHDRRRFHRRWQRRRLQPRRRAGRSPPSRTESCARPQPRRPRGSVRAGSLALDATTDLSKASTTSVLAGWMVLLG